ncbi:hypothetical protein RSOLAG22IIIB_05804 [Rhizoctonia solani]|uniref:Pectate lyase n=1 Tax=Rhizoctonia solani TaxID=456999 RepID=A0A0K6G9H0_9AGAM|nr:hypothetical protein RSOLAG22IIIB_05804 [Rhizoctonia solani]
MNVKGMFDVIRGKVRYDQGKGACFGRREGGDIDAVFLLEDGVTLKQNVVSGANQAEGVHYQGFCNIYNVWLEDVCEDGIILCQTSGTTNIVGRGAKNARNNIIQHKGGGAVNVSSYCVQDFGKLYRTCGNCNTQYKRVVNINDVIAKNGKVMVGINSNFGDVATSKNNQFRGVSSVCDTFQGNTNGKEPTTLTVNKANTKYV